MEKRQEEDRTNDSTHRRKVESRDPGVGRAVIRTSLRTLVWKQNNERTSGPLRTRVADVKRQQRPPSTNDSTRRRGNDARDPGIGHTSGQHSGHQAEKKLTFRHRDRCEPAMRDTELHDIDARGQGEEQNTVTQRRRKRPVHRAQVRKTRWTSPCKMDDWTGQIGHQQELFRDMPSQDIQPCWRGQRNTRPYGSTYVTKPLTTCALLVHVLLAQG